MRYLILSFSLLFLGQSFARKPAKLSETDRQLLIEALKDARNSTDVTATKRFNSALAAFKSALGSTGDTHDLYLNCIEKIRFEDNNKKSQEFREWKRNHSEREDSSEFRRALHHQLRWLVLVLEASKKPGHTDELTPKALSALEAIFSDAEDLEHHHGMLERPVTSTVFAKAYEVDNVKQDNFPTTPLDLESIYDKMIFPALRNPEKSQTLRSAWQKRIRQEGLKMEMWSPEGSVRGADPPAYEKWLETTRHDLEWQMEVDCFKAGDEQAAAKNMLQITQNNLSHEKAPKWIDEFTKMMDREYTITPDGESADGASS